MSCHTWRYNQQCGVQRVLDVVKFKADEGLTHSPHEITWPHEHWEILEKFFKQGLFAVEIVAKIAVVLQDENNDRMDWVLDQFVLIFDA
jgi:hypothetical protein